MAPDAGFEPATKRLTAAYSTAELIRNIFKEVIIVKFGVFVKGLNADFAFNLGHLCAVKLHPRKLINPNF